ncbi:hypothetical protein B0H11DRAFT_2276218 [Mycena galericulata]|nr:hypothetical protein B0H11DRAFT_2276218 [Mycena galericulata]
MPSRWLYPPRLPHLFRTHWRVLDPQASNLKAPNLQLYNSCVKLNECFKLLQVIVSCNFSRCLLQELQALLADQGIHEGLCSLCVFPVGHSQWRRQQQLRVKRKFSRDKFETVEIGRRGDRGTTQAAAAECEPRTYRPTPHPSCPACVLISPCAQGPQQACPPFVAYNEHDGLE